jgi:hypothetical protein
VVVSGFPVVPYATYDRGEQDGHDAAQADDRGRSALVDTVRSFREADVVDVTYLFGFVTGLSEVWEGLNIVDFIGPYGGTS